MTDTDERGYRELFRGLPQPGLLCRLIRDAAGSPVDLEIVDITAMGVQAASVAREALTGVRLMALSGAELVVPILAHATEAAEGRPVPDFPSGLAPNGRHYTLSTVQAGPDLVALFGVDVTDAVGATAELQAMEVQLERRTRDLDEARRIAGLGVWRRDARTGISTWSLELYKMAGFDPAGPPLTGAMIDAHISPEMVRERSRRAAESRRTGEPWEIEYPFHRDDGTERWVLVRGLAERDAAGVEVANSGTAMDITERKLAELELRASEETLRRRTEELEDARRIAGLGVWRVDAATAIVTWSPELYRMAAMDPDGPPLTVASVDASMDPWVVAEREALIPQSIATGEPWQQEYPFHRADGTDVWLLSRGVAERAPDGQLTGFTGTAMDITDRKRAELALRASEERFRAVLDGLVEGAQILDKDWRLVYINQALAGHTGARPEDVIGRSLLDVLPTIAQTEIFRRFLRVMTDRVSDSFDGCFDKPGVGVTWHEFSVQPAPEGIFVLMRDITERRRAEDVARIRAQLLSARTAELEGAGELAGLGVWRADLQSETVVWSAEQYRMFGLDPADGPIDAARVPQLLTPESRIRRDEIASVSVAAGVPWEVELELRRPDGVPGWVLQRGVAESDADGRVVALRGTSLDITDRKRTEADLRRFNEALERRVAERTAELEAANEELRSFSYTISHDLRGPVRAVAGFARILERDHGGDLDESARHSLENIKVAGEAMGHLIDDLLAYTRVGRSALRHEAVPLGAIAHRLAATFGVRAAEIGGTIEVCEPLATPLGDPMLIEELLLNLVDNALNYARPGVPPRVTISAVAGRGGVCLAVVDNGVGIPEDARERIFDVFARIGGTGDDKGTGIGLAIVRKAARSMGTDVTVDSVVGEGTTFSVVFPEARGS